MDDVYKQVFTESEKLIKYLFEKFPKTEFSKDNLLEAFRLSLYLIALFVDHQKSE